VYIISKHTFRLVTGGIILCMGIAAGGLWLQHHIVQEKRKNDEG
jgi:hypothetical protein